MSSVYIHTVHGYSTVSVIGVICKLQVGYFLHICFQNFIVSIKKSSALKLAFSGRLCLAV